MKKHTFAVAVLPVAAILLALGILGCSKQHKAPREVGGLDEKLSTFAWKEDGNLIALIVDTRAARYVEEANYMPLEISVANRGLKELVLTREATYSGATVLGNTALPFLNVGGTLRLRDQGPGVGDLLVLRGNLGRETGRLALLRLDEPEVADRRNQQQRRHGDRDLCGLGQLLLAHELAPGARTLARILKWMIVRLPSSACSLETS